MELIDATNSSLTVSWPPVEGAQRYRLEYRNSNNDSSTAYEVLSENLTSTQARKKNLESDNAGYTFRVGAIRIAGNNEEEEEPTWVTHDEPFQLLSEEEESHRMEAPTATPNGVDAILISWKQAEAVECYELQIRENQGGIPWSTLSQALRNTQVRKKNLPSPNGYMFRVRPAVVDGSDKAFSLASVAVKGGNLSPGMKQVFGVLEDGNLLVSKTTTKPVAEVLAAKEFVLLYASAHWCGPCRQFTPKLINWYQTVKNVVEVVFLSADHDEAGFLSYFSTMPWTAVPFDDDGRERLMGWIKVTGIPRLVVLDGKTGRVLVNNAVGQDMNVVKWRQLAASY